MGESKEAFTRGGSRVEDRALEVVAAALAGGATAAEAGALVGRSERTVRRWMLDQDLSGRVMAHRSEMLSTVTGTLARLASEALEVVSAQVRDFENPAQLKAALAVLDRVLKYHSASAEDARFAELERRLAGVEGVIDQAVR
jgi:Homeodomain-like domain